MFFFLSLDKSEKITEDTPNWENLSPIFFFPNQLAVSTRFVPFPDFF